MVRFYRIAVLGLALLVSPLVARAATDSTAAAVDALFASLQQPGSPGGAIGIYRDNQLLFGRAYGLANLEHGVPNTLETAFNVGSVSKQYAACAIALLARDGKLDLKADIRTYLPWVPDFGETITVADLVHHTSGLREITSMLSLAGKREGDLVGRGHVINIVARQRALNFSPGTEYSYCNTEYNLIAEIVLAVSGKSLREFTQERIFRPLGMTQTYFYDDLREPSPHLADSYARNGGPGRAWNRQPCNYDAVGAGQLISTVGDLAKWWQNFARPGAMGDAALFQQMAAPYALKDGTPVNYGFALWRDRYFGREAIMHTGSVAGYRAVSAFFPAENFSIIALFNNPAMGDLDALLEKIVGLYFPTEVPPAVTTPVDAAALAGTYAPKESSGLTLFVEQGQLAWKRASGARGKVAFHADGSFDLGRPHRTWFTATRDAAGRVSDIVEHSSSGGHTVTYPRVSLVTPTPTKLAELAGTYRSDELETDFRFEIADGRLVGRGYWMLEPMTFVPAVDDEFDGLGAAPHLAVRRDAAGKPVALSLGADRFSGFMLRRVPDAPPVRLK